MKKIYEIDYNRNDYNLDKFAIFAICVANKNADVIAEKVDKFTNAICNPQERPLHAIRDLCRMSPHILPGLLAFFKISPYSQRSRSLEGISTSGIDLRKCSRQELETIPGIGPKTSRFFIVFSRPDIDDMAILDTHILRWLSRKGYDVPVSTPSSGSQYERIERLFLDEWRKQDLPLAEFDFSIWKEMRQ